MAEKALFLVPVLLAACLGARAQSTLAAASAASAAEPSVSPWTANISLTSNYKFRGQDQGTLKAWSPAVQGGFDWTRNGFYLGNWNSNVSFAGNIEMDLYGGYRGSVAKDAVYDLGILRYAYPRNRARTSVDFDTTELYGALSWQWLSLKYSHTVSSDYFGIGQAQQAAGASPRPKGRNTGYLDLSANYPAMAGLVLNAHLGYTRLASDLRNASFTVDDGEGSLTTTDLGLPNYTDWKLGVTWDLGSGFSLAGAVVGAGRKSFYGDINKTRAIATISKSM